jgi:hypothetical protein
MNLLADLPLLSRATDDLDVAGDGRTLEGRAFRWDTPSNVIEPNGRRYWEELARRSTDQSLKMRGARPFPLFVDHRHLEGGIGDTTFTPAAEGLMFRSRLNDGHLAGIIREGIELVKGVSVTFKPIRAFRKADPTRGEVTVRTEIGLRELSLAVLLKPQHAGAELLAVRATDEDLTTPRLDATRRRLRGMIRP